MFNWLYIFFTIEYDVFDVQGHLETVKYLKEAGADITVKDKDGFTPIYAASYKVSIGKVI